MIPALTIARNVAIENGDADVERTARVLGEGYAKAHDQLRLMHALGEAAEDLPAEPLGVLASRLAGPLRTALRTRGRSLELAAESATSDNPAAPSPVLRGALVLVACAERGLPPPTPGADRFALSIACADGGAPIRLRWSPAAADTEEVLPFEGERMPSAVADRVEASLALVLPGWKRRVVQLGDRIDVELG